MGSKRAGKMSEETCGWMDWVKRKHEMATRAQQCERNVPAQREIPVKTVEGCKRREGSQHALESS